MTPEQADYDRQKTDDGGTKEEYFRDLYEDKIAHAKELAVEEINKPIEWD